MHYVRVNRAGKEPAPDQFENTLQRQTGRARLRLTLSLMLQKNSKILGYLTVLAVHRSLPIENHTAGVILPSFRAWSKAA